MLTDRWLKTAYAYLYIRDFQAARRAFDEAITENPENPEYHFHASVTALRNGETGYAMEAAKQAVLLDPENALYAVHLGAVTAQALVIEASAALREGRATETKELLLRALEADPLCERAHELLAELG
ncbi:tetratricopeptide repeat protein [Alicyclobacillus mengziensis]|uniref:Tetratricopeptide repeat protein n=1 Tax=Alicyclobacillus mengziensis TaxID=2931921 RepID=A0A9X7VV70_9BACL|nr:tetratricopeptide repeat protein [Alicyclobacillus mengziensis]QSO45703.1 tetratricopeptide repeat protein [Alicyclobacillus mengziensis]